MLSSIFDISNDHQCLKYSGSLVPIVLQQVPLDSDKNWIEGVLLFTPVAFIMSVMNYLFCA